MEERLTNSDLYGYSTKAELENPQKNIVYWKTLVSDRNEVDHGLTKWGPSLKIIGFVGMVKINEKVRPTFLDDEVVAANVDNEDMNLDVDNNHSFLTDGGWSKNGNSTWILIFSMLMSQMQSETSEVMGDKEAEQKITSIERHIASQKWVYNPKITKGLKRKRIYQDKIPDEPFGKRMNTNIGNVSTVGNFWVYILLGLILSEEAVQLNLRSERKCCRIKAGSMMSQVCLYS
ncbi:hypothetical protein LIER_14115 [Lithospermum erythrorhizon]|uniref:Uncharacterized protein n=1 Tax=Lithospermum erythrorhizon TaxID=34254 RepID=A0AAV3PXX7_LITER